MFYVDDNYCDRDAVAAWQRAFAEHAILGDCRGRRFAACIGDAALWLSLCLYLRERGGSVFPLPVDTPAEAARHRARQSRSHYLLLGTTLDEVLANIEVIAEDVAEGEADTEAVLVQMSSGTTGAPKVIERSWASIEREIQSYVGHFPEANAMTPVVACPVSHSYGLICGFLVALARGLEPVIVQNLNPKFILRKLHEANAPLLYCSPALITAVTMMASPDQPLHAVMTSGTQLQAQWFGQIGNKVERLYQQYGCSEVGCISLGGDLSALDDVGRPLPHLRVEAGAGPLAPAEIRVTDTSGKRIETRDSGYLDDEGRLHFLSRLDDMINVGGLNVYPAEVEDVVLAMDEITDAVVYKRSQGFGNDQVCLNYVASEAVAPEGIRRWCRQHLSAHQVPIVIRRVESIQRLANGKISRKALSEAFA
ncbi:AMP-binding protein [Spongiibacter taiwanensis]|uniref:AMP-binding protein n=1 Tax=Spongiibacter taiwanensis TaxID=1748242 RepID=UPI002035495D|nr:AMP-binding protein [Spongiibacter taiwanensis]USA42683.1 AMP-binding protein [Spongiibacter taiwanensis]